MSAVAPANKAACFFISPDPNTGLQATQYGIDPIGDHGPATYFTVSFQWSHRRLQSILSLAGTACADDYCLHNADFYQQPDRSAQTHGHYPEMRKPAPPESVA